MMKEKNSAVKRPSLPVPAERAKIAKAFPQIGACERPARGV